MRALRTLGLLIAAAIVLSMVSTALATAKTTEATPEATPPTATLPVTVTGADGNDVTVSDISRIIPLNGDIAEIVWALGLGGNVVGVDVSATYPAEETNKLPQIGYQRDLAAEGILSLEPTVIIGDQDAGPPEVIEQLKSAGVPVVIIEDSGTIDAPVEKINAVAEALGVAEAGEALAQKTQDEVDEAIALADEAAEHPRVLFLYVRGATTQMMAGAGTASNALIEAAGGIDAGAEAGVNGYTPITAEAIVAAQPDVLVVLTAGLESVGGVDGLLQIPGIAETPAGQNKNVLDYDDLYFIGMTPRAGQALHDLVLGLHPELADATPEAEA
jgi:iron complex transport system substrate-binding protein